VDGRRFKQGGAAQPARPRPRKEFPRWTSSSITTTGDIYTDWDIDQLEETMRYVIGEDESGGKKVNLAAICKFVPASRFAIPLFKRVMRLAGIEPATSRSGGARSIP
jgi:hypothetical protein